MKILFVLGSLVISGGHYVVLQHAEHLQATGHEVTLAIHADEQGQPAPWHPAIATLRIVRMAAWQAIEDESFDLAIATYWRTALELHRFTARQYAYFVQSIESRFYDESQVRMRALVDRTYALGLPGITEATWIRDHLHTHYGSGYLLAHNGIRKSSYREQGFTHTARDPRRVRVLVEGPFGSFIKNTARSTRVAARSRADEVWLLTSSDLRWYPRVDRVFSRVPVDEVAAVYRSCDVLVKLSLVEGMFGPPLEMFHCGGSAVVYDVSGHDEYIVHGRNALVAPMHDEACVIAHLNRLCDDRPYLAQLKQGARETAAAWPDWPEASRRFAEHVEAIMAAAPVSQDWLQAQTAAIFEEFTAELRPKANPRTVGPSRSSQTPIWQRAKASLRQHKRHFDYILDAYR